MLYFFENLLQIKNSKIYFYELFCCFPPKNKQYKQNSCYDAEVRSNMSPYKTAGPDFKANGKHPEDIHLLLNSLTKLSQVYRHV